VTLGEWFTLAGYLGGLAVFVVFAQRCGFSRREVLWLGLAAVVVGGLGARLAQHLLGGGSLLSTEAGGRTIVAGVLFGWLGVEVAKRLLGVRTSTGAAFALALSLGEGIGRIGCHFNGCCFGREWDGPLAVWQSGAWRFPVQLASSAFALGLFFVLWSLRGRVESGALFRLYLVAFAGGRFFLEFLRGSSPSYGPLTVAQWVCLEVLASVAVLALVVRRREVQRV
jgi:phosphatidylglycerol:prolipoprotein diacylglycerol transferase